MIIWGDLKSLHSEERPIRRAAGLPGQGRATGRCAGADPIWLLIEEPSDGKIEYGFSNLPANTSRLQAIQLWRGRCPVEPGYLQIEKLGLDHHEGRSWRRFHHHLYQVVLAYGFLNDEPVGVGPDRASKEAHRPWSRYRRSVGCWCGCWPQSAGTTARSAGPGPLEARWS